MRVPSLVPRHSLRPVSTGLLHTVADTQIARDAPGWAYYSQNAQAERATGSVALLQKRHTGILSGN